MTDAITGAPEQRVGIRELRHDFRAFVDRAERGERFVITDRGRPVAELAPVARRSKLERMIAEGLVVPAKQPFAGLVFDPDSEPVSTAVSDDLMRERDEDYALQEQFDRRHGL